MLKRTGRNPKRRIVTVDDATLALGAKLAGQCVYDGSPYHKRFPEDYGLTPPAAPRPGKTLCDHSQRIAKAKAEALLRAGLTGGYFSANRDNDWPKNVWTVDGDCVYEAQLGNSVSGTYHGYPLAADDDFRQVVLAAWRKS